MTHLNHFSEDPGITTFEPRAPQARPEVEPMVWTVDADHAWTYLFPRDCPRVLLWPVEGTIEADRARWLGASASGRVACVEWSWFERLRTTTLYRYTFDGAGFGHLSTDDPWMHVSRETVRPLAVDTIGDLLEAMDAEDVELRLMPSLRPLWGAMESSVHFSGIRLRNAKDWELGPPRN